MDSVYLDHSLFNISCCPCRLCRKATQEDQCNRFGKCIHLSSLFSGSSMTRSRAHRKASFCMFDKRLHALVIGDLRHKNRVCKMLSSNASNILNLFSIHTESCPKAVLFGPVSVNPPHLPRSVFFLSGRNQLLMFGRYRVIDGNKGGYDR
jgi:hypothetical protein